jgi:cysteine desulfurase/selenocysteine lyase
MIAPGTRSATLPVSDRRFPALRRGPLNARRIYLDNACLTPAPREVVETVTGFYEGIPGCPLRSESDSSGRLEQRIREAREAVRRFLNAKYSDEIVFTPNTTYGINLLASAFQDVPGRVLISDLEHNSNRLPWLGHERLELAWPPGQPFPLEEYRRALRENIKLVSITALSNVTGAAPPVREIARAARAAGVPLHLDAAQAFPGGTIDVADDLPEFVTFSFHKAYGPTGLGGLYIRRDWQGRLAPRMGGGGSVDDHHAETTTFTSGAPRFEFGLQNYAAIAAVPATMALLSSFSRADVAAHYGSLQAAFRAAVGATAGLRFIGPADAADAHHICTFTIEGADPGRVAERLDLAARIHVRSGRLCAHHWFNRHRVPDVIRVSFGLHNTIEEIEDYARAQRSILTHYL